MVTLTLAAKAEIIRKKRDAGVTPLPIEILVNSGTRRTTQKLELLLALREAAKVSGRPLAFDTGG